MIFKLLSFLIGAFIVYSLVNWIRELLFYRSVKWDFTKEYGESMHFGGEHGFTRRMSTKQKLFLGYPLRVAIPIPLFLILAKIAFF